MIPEPIERLAAGWDDRLLFRRDPDVEAFRVVLDLNAIGNHPMLEMLRWFPGGLTSVELRVLGGRSSEWRPGDMPNGPIVVEVDTPAKGDQDAVVRYGKEGGPFGVTGVWCPDQLRTQAQVHAARTGDDADELFGRLLGAAAGLRAGDIVATSDPYVLAQENLRRQGVCSVEDAFALVGLFTRHHERIPLPEPSGVWGRCSLWLFHWLHARALLPSAWEYVGRCNEAERLGTDRIGSLALAVPRRVSQMLRARDAVLRLAWGAEGRSTDEVLHQFDVFLMMASACYDPTARVVHLLAGQSLDSLRSASWRKKGWRPKVESVVPRDLMGPDSKERAVLDAVAALRNTIHSEPFGNVRSSSFPQIFVGVPQEIQRELLEALNRLGGPEDHGVEVKTDGYWLIRPARLVERLTAGVVAGVEKIVASTDVSLLPVALRNHHPSEDDAHFGRLATEWALFIGGIHVTTI